MAMAKNYTFRKLINDIHLWVGIPTTIVLFIVCLTGTIYVFQREITQWVDSDKFFVKTDGKDHALPLAGLIRNIEREKKDSKVTNIQISDIKNEAWTFTVTPDDIIEKRKAEEAEEKKNKMAEGKPGNKEKSDKRAGEKGKGNDKKAGQKDRDRIKRYLVNPYTGVIQGESQTPTSKFFSTVLKLHRWLLMEDNRDTGKAIIGTSSILMILLELTGLILWLPAKVKSWNKWNLWKGGFKIKTDGNWRRMNFDLHKSLGFYTFIFVTIMAVTGPYFSFKWYREGFSNALREKKEKESKPLQSQYLANSSALSLDDILAKANNVYPYPSLTRISVPTDSLEAISIQKAKTGFFPDAGTDRVTFDQYSGKVLKLERFSDKKTGDKIVSLVFGLHTGEIFGTFSKILYFMACLIATSLPVTGFLIWWGRIRKGKKTARQQTSKPAAIPSGYVPPKAKQPLMNKVQV